MDHNLRKMYEKSGLGCTYTEWLEDACRELNLTAKTRWGAIESLESQLTQHKEKAQSLANHMEEYGYYPSLGQMMDFIKEVAGE